MEYTLPNKTLTLWRIRATVIFALILAVCCFLSVRVSVFFFIPAAVFFIFYLILIVFYLPKLHKSFLLSIKNEGITVKYGVIFEFYKIMPESRLVFIQCGITPLSKLFSLKSITFLAAKARVYMPEIESDKADFITSSQGENNEK